MKFILFFTIFLTILFCSCSSSKEVALGWDYQSNIKNDYSTADHWSDKEILPNTPPKAPHKIIYNAYVNLTVKQIDSTQEKIKKIAKKYKGYIVETGTERAVLRIDHNLLNEVLTAIDSLGKITYKTTSGKDVTEEYIDLQMRLENAINARLRYIDLLKQAEDVKTAVLIEKELERITLQIEQLESKITNIERLTHYATITVNLKQKKKLGPLGYIFKGIYIGVKWLFVRN
jgi:hypothetical protein